MTAEQFTHNGFSANDIAKRWVHGLAGELAAEIVAFAEAYAAAQLVEKKLEIARLHSIVEKASACCTICDDWRSDDSDGATSLRRKAFMELAEAVHAFPTPPKVVTP